MLLVADSAFCIGLHRLFVAQRFTSGHYIQQENLINKKKNTNFIIKEKLLYPCKCVQAQ